MAVFVAVDSIAASIANLGASSAKSRLCEFLIGLRALKLAGDDEVGIAESVEPFMQALFEYTLCESAGTTSTWDGPKFFNPFGSQAGFKSPKFQSNGPANTLHGRATQANAPFDIKTTSPKAIARRAPTICGSSFSSATTSAIVPHSPRQRCGSTDLKTSRAPKAASLRRKS